MDNLINFIMNGATTWTPEVFIRFVLIFTALEGIFSLGAIMLYVGRRC